MKMKKLNWLQLIVSMLVGIGWTILGGAFYHLLKDLVWLPIVIGLYFAGLAVLLLLSILLCNALQRLGHNRSRDLRQALFMIPAILVAAAVFQLIYSVYLPNMAGESSSYIFLIDSSGTMKSNDPDNQRGEAIRTIMGQQVENFPFAVYAFDSDCQMVSGIEPASKAAEKIYSFPHEGGTDIVNAIRTVVKDIENGTLEAGTNPRIILMSDGEASTSGLRSVLKRASEENINICCVGLGAAKTRNLEQIAEGTDGVYVTVEHIDELANAMLQAATTQLKAKRDLINVRTPVRLDGLFSAMRMVFLIILGGMFFWIKALLMRTSNRNSHLILPHVILVTAGALCIEVGMNILYLGETLMQLVMCLCFSCLLNTVGERNNSEDERNVIEERGHRRSAGRLDADNWEERKYRALPEDDDTF